MKTNDKLPKENDYSLAYSSYNTQQDEKDMEYSLYYNMDGEREKTTAAAFYQTGK